MLSKMQAARGIPSTLKNATLAKTELSYLTAFHEGRTVVKTQYDRHASRRLATFIYYCNLHAFCKNEKSHLHLKITKIENQHSLAPKSELCDSITILESDVGPMGEPKG